MVEAAAEGNEITLPGPRASPLLVLLKVSNGRSRRRAHAVSVKRKLKRV